MAALWKGRVSVTVQVWVCGTCGARGIDDWPDCSHEPADGYRPLLVTVEGRGSYHAAVRPSWGWDGGDPGDPGGVEVNIDALVAGDWRGAYGLLSDAEDQEVTRQLVEAVEARVEGAYDDEADRRYDEARDREWENS